MFKYFDIYKLKYLYTHLLIYLYTSIFIYLYIYIYSEILYITFVKKSLNPIEGKNLMKKRWVL